MTTKDTIYVRNFDVFNGIKRFLIIARDYWDEEGNTEKKQQAQKYLDVIIPQQPLEAQGFDLEVPKEISQFAEQSFIGVDDRMWETLDTSAEIRGDVEKGYKLLTDI